MTTATGDTDHDRAVALLVNAFNAEVAEEVGESQGSPASDDKLDAALAYARRGWAVFPLHSIRDGRCTCNKPDCDSPGKHPLTAPGLTKGLKHATTDVERIRRWWLRWPGANIGVATGTASGLVVIDIDGTEGEGSLVELQKRLEELPDTEMVFTARGCHLYFAHPGVRMRNKVGLGPNVDVRADGGYVVAPPSGHITGMTYLWAGDGSEFRLGELPNEWTRMLSEPEPAQHTRVEARPFTGTEHRYAGTARDDECAKVARAVPGERRTTLNTASLKLGGYIASGLIDEERTRGQLVDAGLACGLPIAEVQRTVRDGLRDGMRSPRGPEPRPARETPGGQGSSVRGGAPTEDTPEGFTLTPVDLPALLASEPPPIEYLIEPYVARGRRVWGFGAASSAKSMWAAWVAARLSRDGMKVVYISEENPLDEDHRRLHRLRPEPEHFAFFTDTGLDLTLADHAAALLQVSEGAVLVVLDTLSAVWTGDEGDNRAVADFDLAVLKPLIARGASVLVLHHTGHPQAFVKRGGVSAGRGASSMGQKADVVLNFTAKGGSEFTIAMSKFRGKVEQPPGLHRVIDTNDGGLDIEFVEPTVSLKVSDMAAAMVEIIEKAGALSTKQLRDAVKGGKEVQNAAMQVLRDEDPPRVVVGNGQIETDKGMQTAKVWRVAGEMSW